MENKLYKFIEKILNRAISNNETNEKFYIFQSELLDIFSEIKKLDKDIFEEIPLSIYVDHKDLELKNEKGEVITVGLERDLNARPNISKHIEFFPTKGIVLYDNTYGSAFGHFHYIYRAKGIRIVWFDDSILYVYGIYSTIDNEGFQLSYEQADEYSLSSTSEKCDISSYGMYKYENVIKDFDLFFWLKSLTNLNCRFNKAYYLEYLLTPPDVNRLSNVSITLRKILWDYIIDYIKKFIKIDTVDLFENPTLLYLFDLMKVLDIDIPASKLFDLIKFILTEKKDMLDIKTFLNLFQSKTIDRLDEIYNQNLVIIEKNMQAKKKETERIQIIKDKISKANILEAMELLSKDELSIKYGLENELLHLKSRYNHLKKKVANGTISADNEILEINKISESLIELVDKLKH